jgi:PKHD-type hydroxylase
MAVAAEWTAACLQRHAGRPPPRRPVVARVDGVGFAYDERPVFDGLTFDVAAGEALALTGEAGCGKSTLLRVLAGDLDPLAGTVDAGGPVWWLVPAVALDPFDAVDLGATTGKDIVRFPNEAAGPGLVLADEPDCVLAPGQVLDHYHDALCELGERGQAIVLAAHNADTVAVCERQLPVGPGGVQSRRATLAAYAKEHQPDRQRRRPTPADVVEHVGGRAVMDVDRGCWLLTPHVRHEAMRGMDVVWVLVDPVTRRQVEATVPGIAPGAMPVGEAGGSASDPGLPVGRAWWPGKAKIQNEHAEPRCASSTSYVPPSPLALSAEDCAAIIDRCGHLVAPTVRKAEAIVTDRLPADIKSRLGRALEASNASWWRFDLTEPAVLLARYRPGDGAVAHTDLFPTSATRKLSASVQLSTSDSYTGGGLDLWTYPGGYDEGAFVTTPRDRGTVTVFPAWTPHRVAPIESGERWSLVVWCFGPAFR